MTIMDVPAEAVAARKARHQRDIGELDYRRMVVKLDLQGFSQAKIAQFVGVKQPTINRVLVNARSLPMPAEGFSGADPFEICERYAAGQLQHEELVDELTRWDYAPRATPVDELDDLVVNTPGSVADLERALRQGLIDDETFDLVADQIEARPGAA